jgi:hypothetical protein
MSFWADVARADGAVAQIRVFRSSVSRREQPSLYRAVFGSGCRALRIWGISAASIDGRSRIQA